MNIEVIHEDEAVLLVNKPSNMLVYHSYYARNIKSPSLVDELKTVGYQKLHPIHRLDYKTSGLIILTKNPLAAAHLQNQFEVNTVEKEYTALVRGYTEEAGTIDTPVKNADTGKYREALTHYRRLQITEVDIPVPPYPKSRYSLVQFYPKTGRMHQLRKHANKISHPIIGDHKYGNRHHNKMFAAELGFEHMFLHATSIQFIHPTTGKKMTFTAPFPEFWTEAKMNLGFE